MNTIRLAVVRRFALVALAVVLCMPRGEASDFRSASWATLEDRAALVHVPEGTKRVRLQTRPTSTAVWATVGIVHLDGRAGTVKLRLPDGVELANISVESSVTDPFPYSFYQGRKTFDATPSEPGGARDPGLVIHAPGVVTDTTETADIPGSVDAVQESDIWKWRGRTLYYFNALRGLQVFDLSDFQSPRRIASLRMPAVGEDMYLLGDEHVVLLANRPQYSWEPESSAAGPRSEVVVVRHAGPDLGEIARIPIDGAFMESRMVGSTLCVVTQKVVAIPSPDGGVLYTPKQHVYALDFSDPGQPVVRGPLDVSPEDGAWSWNPAVQATSEFLFVVTNSWLRDGGARSRLHAIDLRTPGQPLAVGTHFNLAGHLRNRFQISYADGILTTVSENNGAVVETWNIQHALLNAGPTAPRPLDSLMVGKNESLFATRFDGGRIYVVTFRRIDPLFCVDQSDPSNLRLLGELEVPGFSTYLEVFADGSRLLSLGVEDSRVAVSLFDVADPTDPTLRSRVYFGDNEHWSWSEGNYDDKAIGFFREAGLMLFPLDQWTREHGYRSGMQLVDATADGLRARGFVDHRFSARRGRLFEETLVSIGGYELIVLDVSDRDQPRKISSLTVAWPVQAVVPYGESVVQIEDGDATSYAPASGINPARTARLRVTSISDLDAAVAEVDLGQAGQVAGTARRGNLMYVLVRRVDGRTVVGAEGQESFSWSSTMTTVVVDLAAPGGPRLAGAAPSSHDGYRWGAGRLESHWLPDGRLLWYPAESTSYSYWWGCLMCDVVFGGGMAIDGGFIGRPWFWGGGQPDDLLVVDVADPAVPRVVVRETAVPAADNINTSRVFLSAENRLLASWSVWKSDDTTWTEESLVQEIDLTDSVTPRRGPIASVPAVVQAVHRTAPGGIVLFASRQESSASPVDPTLWTNHMLVDALAYDGVQAFLLDTARLEGLSYMPTVASGPHFLALRYPANESTAAALRPLSWDEATGKWQTLPDIALAARWPTLHVRGGYLFSSDTWLTEILALHQLPEQPARTLQLMDTPAWDQSRLALDLPQDAAWLPVGVYGVARLDLSGLPAPPSHAGRSQRDRDAAEWHPLGLLPVDVVSVHTREGGTEPLAADADFGFVADADAESFATWASRHFSDSSSSVSGATADPDGDGCDNYSEWAFGSSPTNPDSRPQVTATFLPADDGQPRRLVLVARLNPLAEVDATAIASYLALVPQISSNLTNWRTPGEQEVEVTATPVRRMWSLAIPADAAATFGRLIVGFVIEG